MNISNEKLNELENWINEYLEKQNTYEVHKKDKYEHSIRTANIAKQMYPNNKLLEVAMKFHDIGRFIQYDKIKSFDDKILSHYKLGKQFIEEQEKNNNLSSSEELNMIKCVIEYHMGIKYISKDELINKNEETLKLIEFSSVVDAIDNGCIGATYYIEREILNDEKHYKENYPDLDMKNVSDDVLFYYLNNEKFDKFKYCKTYADYLLYAITLMIDSLKSIDKADKVIQIIDKEDSINKYIKLIKIYINESISERCICHLKHIYKYYKIKE